MRNRNERQGWGRWPLPRLVLAALFLALPLTGCDELLEVDDPDVVDEDTLAGFEGAGPTLIAGTLAEMRQALNSFGDALIQDVGLFTDEFIHSGTFASRREIDRRDINPADNGEISDLFLELQRVRTSGIRAADLIERELGAQGEQRGTALALSGYATIYLAENWCSGVPLSRRTPEREFLFGEPLSTEALLDTAISTFDRALAAAPDRDAEFLARMGKARALLFLGRFDEAAAVVEPIPTTWFFFIEHSNFINNGLWSISRNGRWSQANNEAGVGLPFREATDPRTPWVFAGRGFDRSTPLFLEAKYDERDDDVPIASGIEARLIEAEAALHNGTDLARFTSIIQSLRDQAPVLLALMDVAELDGFETFVEFEEPANFEEAVDELFQERGFWLYATAHRLADFRRLVRLYNRPVDQVYPSGAYFKGGTYGNQLTFPVPVEELNNPQFTQDICDPTQI